MYQTNPFTIDISRMYQTNPFSTNHKSIQNSFTHIHDQDLQIQPTYKKRNYQKQNEIINLSNITQDPQLELFIDQIPQNQIPHIDNTSNLSHEQDILYPQYSQDVIHDDLQQNNSGGYSQLHRKNEHNQKIENQDGQSQLHRKNEHHKKNENQDGQSQLHQKNELHKYENYQNQDGQSQQLRKNEHIKKYENQDGQSQQHRKKEYHKYENQDHSVQEKILNIQHINSQIIMSGDQLSLLNSQDEQREIKNLPIVQIKKQIKHQRDTIETQKVRKSIFFDAVQPKHKNLLNDQNQTLIMLERTSLQIQYNLGDLETELSLNYDISKFSILKAPNQSEQRLQLNENPQYIYCLLCSEFINSSKIKHHSQTCQKSDNQTLPQTKQFLLIRLNDRLKKISYLLEQQLKQLRYFSIQQLQIRKLTCYGILIVNKAESCENIQKIRKLQDDLTLVIYLMEQNQELYITFILQKALETLQQKFDF